jgi:hypothetical protein
MRPESVDNLVKLVRDRMTRKTTDYTVEEEEEEEEACLMQCGYRISTIHRIKILVSSSLVLGKDFIRT